MDFEMNTKDAESFQIGPFVKESHRTLSRKIQTGLLCEWTLCIIEGFLKCLVLAISATFSRRVAGIAKSMVSTVEVPERTADIESNNHWHYF
jgi:hypothetical protein